MQKHQFSIIGPMRSAKTVGPVIFLLLIFMLTTFGEASAIVFKRRKHPVKKLAYNVVPFPLSVPGVQKAWFVAGAVQDIILPGVDDGYFDVLMGFGQGEGAKWFEGKKFRGGALIILDFPIISKNFTLSPGIEYFEILSYPQSERGIDSDPDRTLYLLGEKGYIFNGEVSYYMFERQLEFFYTYFKFDYDPYGYVDYDDNFISPKEAGMSNTPHIDRFGVLLDDTDSRLDPRIGYSIQLERWDWPSRIGIDPEFYQYDLDISGYFPIQEQKLVLVANQFFSTTEVKKDGTVDKSRFICTSAQLYLNPACQNFTDQLYERSIEESKKGRATALGGRNRLRGYREARFFDSHTNFRALELRWYIKEAQIDFDFILEKGVFAGIQLAFFYEQGTVSPDLGSSYWSNFRDSYGIASRFLFNTTVARMDFGFSDEGKELTVWYGYPF